MKEDNKSNPQYTNINAGENMTDKDKVKNQGDQSFSKESSENSSTGKGESNINKRLEDKPGAFLLKETAEDESGTPDKKRDKVEKEQDDREQDDPEEDITEEDITEEDNDDTKDDMFNDDELYLEPFG